MIIKESKYNCIRTAIGRWAECGYELAVILDFYKKKMSIMVFLCKNKGFLPKTLHNLCF